jgi:hypothetical protein
LQPVHRTFGAVLIVQTLDVLIHAASGMLEPLRVSANVMLVLGAWMILGSPAGAKGVGVANGFAFLVLNGVFVAVHGMTNPVTGNLRVPMVVLVVGSLVALMLHVRVAMNSEPA